MLCLPRLMVWVLLSSLPQQPDGNNQKEVQGARYLVNSSDYGRIVLVFGPIVKDALLFTLHSVLDQCF
jgi:hypothetical protein